MAAHTITKEIEIDGDDLLSLVVDNQDNSDVIEFIKEIDDSMGDWDFTEELIQMLYRLWKEGHGEPLELEAGVVLTFPGTGKVKVTNNKDDTDDDDEAEEDEDGHTQPVATKSESDHNHVYRGGSCYCGAVA